MIIVAISLSVLVMMSPTVFAQSGGVAAEIDALNSAVTSLKSTVSNLVSDFSSLKNQQQTNIQDIASLKQTVSALGIQEQTDANDIKSLKQSIATQASQIADLQNTVNSQAAVIAQLNQAVASLENSQTKIKLLVNFPSNGAQTVTTNVWAYAAYFQVVNGVGQSINIDSALNGITLTVNGQKYQASSSFGPGLFYIRHDQDSGMQANEYQIVFYTNTASLSNESATIGGIPDIGTFTTPAF
jgi:archaellum component FlaC